MKHIEPFFKRKTFTCPNCGVLTEHTWSDYINIAYTNTQPNGNRNQHTYQIPPFFIAQCSNCRQSTYWLNEKMFYPLTGIVPLPNEDMPQDVKDDYLEARDIVMISPRGSVALLRLALQKLCVHLGEKGKNINEDIKNLVKKGLPEYIQQALDTVRVIGNHAVHPGQIDLKDDYETAYKIFGYLNVICEIQISLPKKTKEFYDFKVPEHLRDEISKRDGKSTT